jgi:NAD(P)-dependent dehydrogenase (short-subunit alcohol dehydrogenase family)
MGVLEGRTAIGTGAGGGIGHCEDLALAAGGAAAVVNDLGSGLTGVGADDGPAHDVVHEILAAGGQAVADTAAVSSFRDAEALDAWALEHFVRLDVLVNNAGVIGSAMSVNMSEEDFDLVFRVHGKGSFATSHVAAIR